MTKMIIKPFCKFALFVSCMLGVASCDLFTANMSEFVEKYSDYVYVENWSVSPISEIIPETVYNDRRNMTIKASGTADLVIDLEMNNPEDLDYIVEYEVSDSSSKTPPVVECERVSGTLARFRLKKPAGGVNFAGKIRVYDGDRDRAFSAYEMPVIHTKGGTGGGTGPLTLTLTAPAKGAVEAAVWKAQADGQDIIADATAADGTGKVAAGQKVTLTVQPAAGQTVSALMLHKTGDAKTAVAQTTAFTLPVDPGVDGTATFDMPAFDVTATLVFIPNYLLTLAQPFVPTALNTWTANDGNKTFEGMGPVLADATVTLTITPVAGARVMSITIHKDGDPSAVVTPMAPLAGTVNEGGTGTVTFTMPAYNVVAEPEMEYKLTYVSTPGNAAGKTSLDPAWYAEGTAVDIPGQNSLTGNEPTHADPERKFLGWTTAAGSGGFFDMAALKAGSSAADTNWYKANSANTWNRKITINGPITLYAIWGLNVTSNADFPAIVSTFLSGNSIYFSPPASPFTQDAYYNLTRDIAGLTYTRELGSFSGVFEGNGHTVNLDGPPLLMAMSIGKIRNFKLTGKTSWKDEGGGEAYAGSVTPKHGLNGIIENVASYVDIDVSTSLMAYVGGITGDIRESPQIKNCVFAGTVTVTGSGNSAVVGGIAGRAPNIAPNMSIIENCYVLGDVTVNNGSNRWAGGIIGATYLPHVENCVVLSDKIDTSGSSSPKAGRILGEYSSGGDPTLTNNYANSAMLVDGSRPPDSPLNPLHGTGTSLSAMTDSSAKAGFWESSAGFTVTNSAGIASSKSGAAYGATPWYWYRSSVKGLPVLWFDNGVDLNTWLGSH